MDRTPSYYADTGCSFFSRCLECPLAKCRYDSPYADGEAASFRQARNAEMRRLYAQGKKILEIATQFGLSRRHTQAVLYERRFR